MNAMRNQSDMSLREYIAKNIESNEYLTFLYSKLLNAYSRKIFLMSESPLEKKELGDLLSFADLLAKTACFGYMDSYKELAQEIMVMIDALSPGNPEIRKTLAGVLSSASNFLGLELVDSTFSFKSFWDELAIQVDKDYLAIPEQENQYFFPDQKLIFDNLSNDVLSFSGPTSLGKTFLFINFVRKEILDGKCRDYFVILPTRALVSEVRSELIEKLGDLLRGHGYRVVSSPVENVAANIVCVMTPERFLSFMEQGDVRRPDYVFIDEAQIISSDKERSLLYYRIVDRVMRMEKRCNLIFSSPNIPNPDVFNQLIPTSAWDHLTVSGDDSKTALSSEYTPVVHFFYYMDLADQHAYVLDRRKKEFSMLGKFKSVNKPLSVIENLGRGKKNIVYCKSTEQAMRWAVEFAEKHTADLPSEQYEKLKQASSQIVELVHKDCFLAETIKKGVAYHIGLLPASVRKIIESLFRDGSINTIFCTSTIIEGVNFPCDNLFITSHKNGNSNLSSIEFKNLVGRAGRIRFQLSGNIYFVWTGDKEDKNDLDHVKKLCLGKIPEQTLSVEHPKNVKRIKKTIEDLANNDILLNGDASHRFERMYSTMLTRDLSLGYEDSAIVMNAKENASEGQIDSIRRWFPKGITYDEYYISNDQITKLDKYILNGGAYPVRPGRKGHSYEAVSEFMSDLKVIFNWDVYNKSTLGRGNSHRWYSYLLFMWVNGTSVPELIASKLKRYEEGKDKEIFGYQNAKIYDGTPMARNMVMNGVLSDIDKVLLHELADYFRIFSRRYRVLKKDSTKLLQNDWSKYIEYGTADGKTIRLVEIGFSRRIAKKILARGKDIDIRFSNDGAMHIERSILNCDDAEIREEAIEVEKNHWDCFYTSDPEDIEFYMETMSADEYDE